ncbi:MAG: hypothetical protein IPG17_30200 [Sandaracinaceae bacterium]|jgi:hypothetical protein|nr:hypothetical protein [Sandaracinaceae bacterium]MBK7156004.1 hypothetical protein [Sandaracinaceae bacterium]MBK8406375.1 hypothetical protein [Sandaracinaceae bacterium]MBK8591310.1 hypothetical protein [Sandaracinaceae bacterium]
MTKQQALLTAGLAFFFGCASAPFIVPPLSAQQAAAGVQRWEHRCVEVDGGWRYPEHATEVGQQMGAEGWELAATVASALCFKRPLH